MKRTRTIPDVQRCRAELACIQKGREARRAAIHEEVQRRVNVGTGALDVVVPWDGHQV